MTNFEPPSFDPMPCVWGHCFAVIAPRVHRIDPYDASMIEVVYPIHDVEGVNSWFGRCPASQLIVMPTITDAGRAALSAADKSFVRRLAERINRVHTEARSELGPEATDEELIATMREAMQARPAVPSVDDYFPGRPADAPEPGVGEAPAVKLPLNQIGQPLGKAGEMSTQETHVAMIEAARAAIGEAQETLAVTLSALETIENAVGLLPPKVTAAHALVHAAVGNGENLPEVAINMRANVTAALDTTTGEGSVAHAVLLVRSRVSTLAAQLSAASDNGQSYAAMPK
jgi:hypothetical protein